jgi:(E)-4-hydroxy-3-methylbut-2-enyl-diphosphate synthase
MEFYCESLSQYKRLATREVRIGGLLLGNFHPIRVQTMTTTDTMDTMATVEQSIRCIEAGSELIRITAPSKREAENLLNVKKELRARGYTTPIVADIHFTPNAAEIAARIVEKVRINPGNYIDKKKFEIIEYSDADYQEEIDRIRERFTPLIKICKEYGTAMRIGTNHGSLSDRIMSRYGDTPTGMVESAMEFLRIARDENYHEIVLSMKSSNPQVMVHAYRFLVKTMADEFGECYPLHLGVTEAGDGEDGRIKSSIGIGALLEDGLGDTIRVSLTEDPELEIPVCKDLVARYQDRSTMGDDKKCPSNNSADNRGSLVTRLPYDPFNYQRRETFAIDNIGGKHVPVVISDVSKIENITRDDLQALGYIYDVTNDKWNISEAAADYIFTANQDLNFPLPGTLKVVLNHKAWMNTTDKEKCFPIIDADQYLDEHCVRSSRINFVSMDYLSPGHSPLPLQVLIDKLKKDNTVVVCLSSANKNAMQSIRKMFVELENNLVRNPAILMCDSAHEDMHKSLVHYSTETGALLLDGFADGLCLGHHFMNKEVATNFFTMNSIAFSILQATRTRISKTEYISCPSCGRTLFDLQETTARIRAVTNHLKGVKIAIMGCIVNGPGEMADADFGYVGSGPGRITLYRGKEIVKRNVKSEVAVQELINLLKENDAWIEP